MNNDREYDVVTRCPSKAYLYWVTREQSSFAWFRDFIKELPKGNKNKVQQQIEHFVSFFLCIWLMINALYKMASFDQLVVEMHNFLTCMYKEEDARSTLLSAIQVLYHAKYGIDIVSQTPVHTHFARPNWFRIFSKLSRKHQGARIGKSHTSASLVKRNGAYSILHYKVDPYSSMEQFNRNETS